MTDEQYEAIVASMPQGMNGFLGHWGLRQFADKVEEAARADVDTAARLQLLCRKLGLENAIPDHLYRDPEALVVIFGQMRAQIDWLIEYRNSVQAALCNVDPKWRERGEFGVNPTAQALTAITDLSKATLTDAEIDLLRRAINFIDFRRGSEDHLVTPLKQLLVRVGAMK